jgi:acetyl esterase/lipase
MRTLKPLPLSAFLCIFAFCGTARAEEPATYTRTRDVIYGRKFGLAMTMDVFTPKEKANGAAVILVVSGGWFSNPDAIRPAFAEDCLSRGYTVFAVCHGSQPKFTLPEIIEDMHRSVRFIRCHAKDYKIDPDRIGIMGGSAGGHLALMMGTAGKDGNPDAKDPVDRASSKVQAVACFFPPTDFLNYGAEGKEMIDRAFQPPYTAATDYHEYDPKKALYVPVTDKDKLREISKNVSPVSFVTKDSAPTLLIHGDKDKLVPIQQSEEMLAKLKEAKVPAELIVKKDAVHGWPTILEDVKSFGDWFDKYLAK